MKTFFFWFVTRMWVNFVLTLPPCCHTLITRGGVEDTRLEAKAKDTKKIRGQGQPFRGQTLSRPGTVMLEAKAKDKCSQKKKRSSQNFSSAPQNFNNSKNSAVLEPRTGQFSRTWGLEAKDFKMCPRGQGRPRGLHLCWLRPDVAAKASAHAIFYGLSDGRPWLRGASPICAPASGELRARRGPGFSSNIEHLQFCVLQKRREKCHNFLRILMWSPKKIKKRSLRQNATVFSWFWCDLQLKEKGLRSSTYWFVSVILMGPMKPMGPLCSIAREGAGRP